MTDVYIISFIINGLLGVAMYFMKQANDNTKERLSKVEGEVDKIKESTVKKEDFREFKEELWLRFDKMEITFEKKLESIK